MMTAPRRFRLHLPLRFVLLVALLLGSVSVSSARAGCPTFPYTVPAGDTAALIQAITCANSAAADDVINLTNSTYTLTAISGTNSGLPPILSASAAGTLTINGSGATITRSTAGGTPEFRLLLVETGGNLTLDTLTLSNGFIQEFGGAILNNGSLTVTNSTIRGNTAGAGGGISNGGSFNFLNSTLSGNIALQYGGAIENFGGAVLISNSTVSGNSAEGSNSEADGGGALDSYFGSAFVAVINSTITGNTAVTTDRSGLWTEAGVVSIQNSIIADNNGSSNCASTGGAFTDNSGNLDNGTSCGFSGAVGQNTEPLLEALGYNGGLTLTHALLPGSPAINAGINALAVGQEAIPLTTDQRGTGFARINNGTVDIGAFESTQAALNVQLTLQGRSAPAPDPSRIVTVHVQVKPQGGGATFYSQDITSDDSSFISLSNLTAGTYLFSFKGTHTLARQYTLTLNAGTNGMTTDMLLEGDADDKNAVTITDFAILAASFGKAQGGAGYDARADFNGDNAVTILDFSLLAANFGRAGDGGVYP